MNTPDEDNVIVPPAETKEKISIARDFKIFRKDVKDFGMSEGCKGCLAADSGDPIARNHDPTCRKRMLTEIEKTDPGRITRILEKMGVKEMQKQELQKVNEAPTIVNERDLEHEKDEDMIDGTRDNIGNASGSSEKEEDGTDPSSDDINMQAAIFSISADHELSYREYYKHDKQTLDDGVKKMNAALAKEGFEYSIIEAYSPKRVTGMGELMGLIPGMSLDLTENDVDGQPWDFNIADKRERAMRLVKSKKALLLIGSPMCAAFSQLQNINFGRMSPIDVERVKKHGTKHLEFCAELYRIQYDNGLYFLHEHPFGASSWNNEKIQKLLSLTGVSKVKSHMCVRHER